MWLRLFTLRFSAALEGFDDGPLRSFCAGKEVLSVRDQFFVKDEVPYWRALFADGFEGGDLSAWSGSAPRGTEV